MSRCDICLEENCKGKHQCNCESCIHIKECYKFLHPTIRLTTKCTQSCDHCCFSCSPDSKRVMSIETAKEIREFLKNNNIVSLNVMGGEFFCNPNWYEILSMFLEIGCDIRLVSNGDWGNNNEIKNKIKALFIEYNRNFHISLSKDEYHTNQFIDEAIKFLNEIEIKYNVGETSEDGDNGLVPIGRSIGECGFYGTLGCYCHNPKYMYSFLIDEDGNIFKCSFGSWKYANIKEYKDGGFAKRFKEFNKAFYKCFISSCASCIRIAEQDEALVNNE